MEFELLRFYVKTRWILGESATQISNDLTTAYGDLAPSYNFIAKWIRLFKDGRENIKDDPRSGRPITTLTEDNIELVREIIDDNPYATYVEIEVQTSLSPPTIYSIIHEHLGLRKVASRYVPHNLTQKNKQEISNFTMTTLDHTLLKAS